MSQYRSGHLVCHQAQLLSFLLHKGWISDNTFWKMLLIQETTRKENHWWKIILFSVGVIPSVLFTTSMLIDFACGTSKGLRAKLNQTVIKVQCRSPALWLLLQPLDLYRHYISLRISTPEVGFCGYRIFPHVRMCPGPLIEQFHQ